MRSSVVARSTKYMLRIKTGRVKKISFVMGLKTNQAIRKEQNLSQDIIAKRKTTK